jgi:hypothetical protein
MSTIEKKSVNVGKYVTSAHVDQVIRNYKKERWVHNSARIGKEDSLSGWYSIEELEDFITNCKSHGADGIKMYFAAYPVDYAPRPEYAALQTIVLVATKSGEGANGSVNKDIYISKGNSAEIIAYNASKMCPPFCNGDGIAADTEWGGLGLTLIDRGEDGLSVI